jgi:hypothetical protein
MLTHSLARSRQHHSKPHRLHKGVQELGARGLSSSIDAVNCYPKGLWGPSHLYGRPPSCIQGRNRLLGVETPWCTVHFR